MTNSIKKAGATIATTTTGVLAWASVTFAQVAEGLSGAKTSLDDVGSQVTGGAGTTNLPTLVGGIINVVLGILGIVFVVLIVWAGIMYMMAGGDTEKVKKATAIIKNGLIGLVITVAAYAISKYVIVALTQATT